MKRSKGKAMTSRPEYVPESTTAGAMQHPVVRRLGPNAIWTPALMDIVKAANELAAELGKIPDRLTDEEADRAIELGKQRHADREN